MRIEWMKICIRDNHVSTNQAVGTYKNLPRSAYASPAYACAITYLNDGF